MNQYVNGNDWFDNLKISWEKKNHDYDYHLSISIVFIQTF